MISWIIKTSCLCYLPQPSASADNIDLGFDNSFIKTSCQCYLPQPSASADSTVLGFDNSWYHAQPHPIIVYYMGTITWHEPAIQGKISTWSAVNFKKHMTSINSQLEPVILWCATRQRIPCFSRCQMNIIWMPNIKKDDINQRCMSLSTNELDYGYHLERLRRRRRHRPAYAPTSSTASHDSHEKINSWVSFSFLSRKSLPQLCSQGKYSPNLER